MRVLTARDAVQRIRKALAKAKSNEATVSEIEDAIIDARSTLGKPMDLPLWQIVELVALDGELDRELRKALQNAPGEESIIRHRVVS